MVLPILDVGLAFIRLDEGEHLAVDVVSTLLHELLPDVVGYLLNVVLQEIDIGEYGVVDTLQYVVRGVRLNSCHLVGVIDESIAQGLDFTHRAADGEMTDNRFELIHH